MVSLLGNGWGNKAVPERDEREDVSVMYSPRGFIWASSGFPETTAKRMGSKRMNQSCQGGNNSSSIQMKVMLFPIMFRLIQGHPQRCRIQKPYLGSEEVRWIVQNSPGPEFSKEQMERRLGRRRRGRGYVGSELLSGSVAGWIVTLVLWERSWRKRIWWDIKSLPQDMTSLWQGHEGLDMGISQSFEIMRKRGLIARPSYSLMRH